MKTTSREVLVILLIFANSFALIMVTIISGTNRVGSNTRKIAQYYYDALKLELKDVHFISLEDFECHWRSEDLVKIEKELLIPTETFLFVMPEYNGTFPGILKTFVDNTDIRKAWWFKKAMIVGLADGRGGNLRGIDQWTNVLHYLKMMVHHNKLPLSNISKSLNADGSFKNIALKSEVDSQIEDFIEFSTK